MSDLPAPLTPPDCDLRDFAWMPLDVVRLRDSDLAGLSDAEAFRCAMLLFCAAWHQVPAASLPDDDSALARLAGYGRDLKTFAAAKNEGALRGWLKCSDGRLYHAVQAGKAREAWENKIAQRARTAKARAAKMLKANAAGEPQGIQQELSQSQPPPVTEPVTASNREDRRGQDIKEPPSLRSVPPDPSRGTRLPADWRPDAACVEAARAVGLDAGALAEGFRDYWHAKPGKDARKVDWTATWRNWCREEARRAGKTRGAPGAGPSRAEQQNARMRALVGGGTGPPTADPGLPLLAGTRGRG